MFPARQVDYRSTASLPAGERIYAVGDIHGQLHCLQDLEELILTHLRTNPIAEPKVIYLGDYVDRGLETRATLEHLISRPMAFAHVHLRGNHERALLHFLSGQMPYATWMRWGGDATIRSYGVPLCSVDAEPDVIDELRARLAQAIPQTHLEFLHNLPLSYEAGDYIFVHAGMRPGFPLSEQVEDDLLMIRAGFLDCEMDGDKTVIHGHTIFKTPHIRNRSIGIDTGAYATGVLTAIVLEDDRYEFLATS